MSSVKACQLQVAEEIPPLLKAFPLIVSHHLKRRFLATTLGLAYDGVVCAEVCRLKYDTMLH